MTLRNIMQVRTGRDGVLSRRSFLAAAGAAGATGLFGWRDTALVCAEELRRQNKACILLFMRGGPSQFETFDPKPGHENGGPTQAIDTAATGIQIAEGWENTARQMDKIALI